MSIRIGTSATPRRRIRLQIDGHIVEACAGETIAAAMLAAGIIAFRWNGAGEPHGLFCNTGTCSACYVTVQPAGSATPRRLRACLVTAEDAMVVATGLVARG